MNQFYAIDKKVCKTVLFLPGEMYETYRSINGLEENTIFVIVLFILLVNDEIVFLVVSFSLTMSVKSANPNLSRVATWKPWLDSG